jgi:2-alkenal reductase
MNTNTRRFLVTAAGLALLLAAACTGGATRDAATSAPAEPASEVTSAAVPVAQRPADATGQGAAAAVVDAAPIQTTASAASGSGVPAPAGTAVALPQATPTHASVAALATADDADRIVAAEETVLNRVYGAVLPSIVNIKVAQRAAIGDTFGFGQQGQGVQPTGEGSGFVWDREGNIVTNNHVVAGADIVSVRFFDGTEVLGDVVGTDPFSDLAVVRVDLPADRLQPVALGNSSVLKVGQIAIAIGHPFGQTFTMTSGIVSAVGRLISSGATSFGIPEAIQTDAAINPGNSGGPLLDREARVIGINAQIETTSGMNAGVGFAIPIDIAKNVVPALIKDGVFKYAYLGVSLDSVSQEIASLMDLPQTTRGALISEVTGGGPAARAGLRGGTSVARTRIGQSVRIGGDIVVKVNGIQIRSSEELIAYTALKARPGETVKMTVLRSGKEQTIDVTLGTRPG